jgi:hypothetical protein
MKKTLFFSMLIICVLPNCYSQNLNPNVIASAGGIAKTDKISLEWTLGESAVETITSAKNLYTQGFHQPYLAVKSFHSPPQDNILLGYNIAIAPNPARSFVNVSIGAKDSEKYLLSLFDMDGKTVYARQITGNNLFIRIEMGHLPSGVYLVNVRNDSGIMRKAFKIIKVD